MDFIADHTFTNIDFRQQNLEAMEYEACVFENCNFSSVSLAGFRFSDCKFVGCNMTAVLLPKTNLNNIAFNNCKLMGVQFQYCSTALFTVDFENCILDLSSFYELKMKNTRFKDCRLREVDFSATILTGCLFNNCDCTLAVFDNTNLEKADFATSYNFSIDPQKNKLKKTKFSASNLSGLVDKLDIIID